MEAVMPECVLAAEAEEERRWLLGHCVLCQEPVRSGHASAKFCTTECRQKYGSLLRAARKAGLRS